ncbi:putative F-box/LRR-repeat protein-like [Capsicum annuum]|nr:putative F-box/LRR-repeat protein-like [Capsicum annuum]
MLQWMGGSRRKVDASRRSTQKRQKQFFEQRKWHEQQKKDARESFFEEKNPCYQPEKNSRSLDILSLLNLSTGSGEHKSNVHSARHIYEDNQMLQPSPVIQTKKVICLGSLQRKEGTSPSYQDDAACPQNTSVGAPGGHEKALYSTDHKENPLTNSTSKQLSIIDILGDDGPNCELGSSTHEGHVAFSFEGLGKVEMSTPVHSPQQPGRSSCPRARRKGLSSDYLNRGIYGIEFELDRMMVDVELPFRTSPLDGSSCSRGTPDLPGSAEHKLPDTKWFSSNNNFTYLHAFENDEIFGKKNFSVSDGEWYSMGCASPHLMDYIDHADMTWFANEDARDNLSLLSEESSTAVVGDLDTQQKMNSNNKRRSQEDVSDGSKEKKFCEMLFSKERNCKRSDIQLGKEMDEPTKSPWPLNQSRAEPEHGNPVFYEKRSDMNNDQPREARYSPGESNSRFRSFYQTSGSKRYVSTCSDFSVGDVLTDWEPKLQVDTLQNFKGSNKYPGEYAPSSFMLEPTTFALDSPGCTFRNLFQDAKKACGTEDSLHSLGSHGTVTGNFVRDVGKIPYFLSDGDKGVDILPFDSSQFVPITEVSGRCKGFSSGKEKSLDVSSSVNRCSNCEEPKEKTPEVKDRTRLFNYSECAEEASLSIEISTVSKGDQDSSDKNQDTQIFT